MKSFLKFLRRFLSSWHGLIAGLVALAVYLCLPLAIRWYDPTAGVFDAGYLVWVGLGTFLALWAGFVGWVMFQLFFASLDKAAASDSDEWGNLRSWFDDLPTWAKWMSVQFAFAFCVIVFLFCLRLIPIS